MANLNDSVGTNVTITLAGDTYKATKLTITDWAEFEEFVHELRRSKIIQTAKDVYGDKLPDSVLDKALAPPTDDELGQMQASITGMRFLVWRSLITHNKGMTPKDVGSLITLDDIKELSAKLFGAPGKNAPKTEGKK